MTGQRERFAGADPLRGLGALSVFVFHCAGFAAIGLGLFEQAPWTWLARAPIRILESMNFGVYLFFALSGYLLGRPFITAYIDDRPLPEVGKYLRNRALRVLPGVLAMFVISLAVLGSLGTGWGKIAAVPLLAQVYFPSRFAHAAVAHFWTLDDEVLFYLLLPLAVWVLATAGRRVTPGAQRRRLVLGMIGVLAVVSLAMSSTPQVADFDKQEWFLRILSAFAPGLALAALSTTLPSRLATSPRARALPRAMLASALVAFAYFAYDVVHPHLLARNLAANAAAGLIVGAALVREWSGSEPWRVLDNRPAQWLGRRSYSFYLIHPLVIYKVIVPLDEHGGPQAFAVYLVAGLALLIPLTALSYELLERPFLARRRPWDPAAGRAGIELAPALVAPASAEASAAVQT